MLNFIKQMLDSILSFLQNLTTIELIAIQMHIYKAFSYA